MLRNYILVAFRTLLRHKTYSWINIAGLSVGMVCFIFIGLYIQHELSYDRFHPQSNQIYRVLRKTQTSDGHEIYSSNTSGALAAALKADFPEVERVVRRMGWGGVWVQVGKKGFEQRFCLADADFLEVFNFALLKGSAETVLREPASIVLTASMAAKYFGERDPIGQMITVDDRYFGGEYRVTGVLADIPENSYFQFDFLTSTVTKPFGRMYWERWHRGDYRPVITYVILKEGVDPAGLESKFSGLITQYMGEETRATNAYHLQPLKRRILVRYIRYWGFS